MFLSYEVTSCILKKKSKKWKPGNDLGVSAAHQVMCLEEIELLAQNVITNLGSIFNISGEDLYGHFMSMRIFTSRMNKKDIHMSSESYEESSYGLD